MKLSPPYSPPWPKCQLSKKWRPEHLLESKIKKDLIHPTWPLNKNRLQIQKRNYEYESYDQIEFIIKNMDA